jgi:hypothetical protein
LSDSSAIADTEIERLAASLLLFKTNATMQNELPMLRLSHGGWETVTYHQLVPLNPRELERIPSRKPLTCSYTLDWNEVDDFVRFWSSLVSFPWPPNLMASVRRLIAAQNRYGDHYYEDVLMDLVISLEAIVLRKNEHPKGRPLSERTGKLTRLISNQLSFAVAQLALAYDLRNDIVHDGSFDPSNMTKLSQVGVFPRIEFLLLEVQRYVRIALREYIFLSNQGLTKEQIISRL